jgi:hypothetical protein
MIRVTRDRVKLRDVPFIEFRMWEERPIFPNEKASVCGGHWDPVLRSWNSQKRPIPAKQAFELTRQFALDKGISDIWIDDPDQKLDVGLRVQNRLIDYLDDHS